MKKALILLFLITFAIVASGADFNFDTVKNRVSEFTLSNGLKFILLEDHSVPIAICGGMGWPWPNGADVRRKRKRWWPSPENSP